MWLTLVALVKSAILHFYGQTFQNTAFIRIVYAVMAIVIAFWISAFFADVFFCIPVHKTWLPETPGRCGESSSMYIGMASADLAIDIVVLILPMPILWGLQLPAARKVALTFVFGLGFIIIFITSIRLKFFLELDPFDFTYTFSKIALLSTLVPLLGITNANLPIMGPAFQRIFRSSLLTSQTRKSSNTGSSGSRFQKMPESELPLVGINGEWLEIISRPVTSLFALSNKIVR
ncbi:uncharacterized protein JN550_003892 [Neoarthrinium moseri]|nr:uncharacterized protein JN550_003892 [Neoarthrinium moseri]KAI1872173.1 hypothetical protein JN550_003892 [Neoarthrinium moseri]